jgi:hypothetical protein
VFDEAFYVGNAETIQQLSAFRLRLGVSSTDTAEDTKHTEHTDLRTEVFSVISIADSSRMEHPDACQARPEIGLLATGFRRILIGIPRQERRARHQVHRTHEKQELP